MAPLPASNAGRWLLNRRDFLRFGGTGLGGIALTSLLAEQRLLGAGKTPIRPQWSPGTSLRAAAAAFRAQGASNVLMIFLLRRLQPPRHVGTTSRS